MHSGSKRTLELHLLMKVLTVERFVMAVTSLFLLIVTYILLLLLRLLATLNFLDIWSPYLAEVLSDHF